MFLGLVAERYFRITSEAIKAADPNHMVFGSRFAYVPPEPVVAASAKYLEVVSFNCYANDPLGVIKAYSAFGKPLIIGEFSFRGKDSGLPNTRGAGPVVETQQDRANAFSRYVTLALGEPNLVGYHWFEHCDEPKEGRFDGEDSNYGVVNIKDEPYITLTQEMARINARAEQLHRGSRPAALVRGGGTGECAGPLPPGRVYAQGSRASLRRRAVFCLSKCVCRASQIVIVIVLAMRCDGLQRTSPTRFTAHLNARRSVRPGRQGPVRDCVGVRRRVQRGSGKLDKRRPQNVAFRRRRLYAEWGSPGFQAGSLRPARCRARTEAGEAVSQKPTRATSIWHFEL